MNIEKEFFVDSSFPDQPRRLRDATYHMELTVWTHDENEKTFQYNTSYSFISYSNLEWYYPRYYQYWSINRIHWYGFKTSLTSGLWSWKTLKLIVIFSFFSTLLEVLPMMVEWTFQTRQTCDSGYLEIMKRHRYVKEFDELDWLTAMDCISLFIYGHYGHYEINLTNNSTWH